MVIALWLFVICSLILGVYNFWINGIISSIIQTNTDWLDDPLEDTEDK